MKLNHPIFTIILFQNIAQMTCINFQTLSRPFASRFALLWNAILVKIHVNNLRDKDKTAVLNSGTRSQQNNRITLVTMSKPHLESVSGGTLAMPEVGYDERQEISRHDRSHLKLVTHPRVVEGRALGQRHVGQRN